MNITQLKQIIATVPVYYILSHNVYDPKTEGNEIDVYNYIFENGTTIEEDRTTTDYFDNRRYPYSYNTRFLIGKL
jgi:hypothetical protein